jgi:hypothetical protein
MRGGERYTTFVALSMHILCVTKGTMKRPKLDMLFFRAFMHPCPICGIRCLAREESTWQGKL